jgi:hypothetical protein
LPGCVGHYGSNTCLNVAVMVCTFA